MPPPPKKSSMQTNIFQQIQQDPLRPAFSYNHLQLFLNFPCIPLNIVSNRATKMREREETETDMDRDGGGGYDGHSCTDIRQGAVYKQV